jgi:excinuclease UvrABC nuclease subunit
MLGYKIQYTIDNFSDILLVDENNLPINSKIGVYFLYDENKNIIYIGKSVTSIRSRLRNHLFVSNPSPYDDWRNQRVLENRKLIKFFAYSIIEKNNIDMVERFLINNIKPKLNVEFNY